MTELTKLTITLTSHLHPSHSLKHAWIKHYFVPTYMKHCLELPNLPPIKVCVSYNWAGGNKKAVTKTIHLKIRTCTNTMHMITVQFSWRTSQPYPHLWTYSSMFLGMSKLITCLIFGTSSPLAATDVQCMLGTVLHWMSHFYIYTLATVSSMHEVHAHRALPRAAKSPTYSSVFIIHWAGDKRKACH